MSFQIGTALATSLKMMVAVEQALPDHGLGQTKKQIVVNGVETALKATSAIAGIAGYGSLSLISGVLSSFIDETVAILNKAKAGPFGQTDPAANTSNASDANASASAAVTG